MWLNQTIDKEEWTDRVLNGCAMCTDQFMDDDEVLPINPTQFLCSSCGSTELGKTYLDNPIY